MPQSFSGKVPSHAMRHESLRPRKRLGQNFLQDTRHLATIVRAAALTEADSVLELGAGTGVLTRALLEHAGSVTAVELDDNLFGVLTRDFAADDRLQLLHQDALAVDPCAIVSRPYKLVANIPYYITGAIIRKYLETECQPTLLVLMLQREVAQRLTAVPGKMSMLAVSAQFYAAVKIVATVPAGAFFPRPKVDSAIVLIEPYVLQPGRETRDSFFSVARAGFGTRRKQIARALRIGLNLSSDVAHSHLQRAGIESSRRAETLSIAEWKRLAAVWSDPASRA